jgi:hypothetical protein
MGTIAWLTGMVSNAESHKSVLTRTTEGVPKSRIVGTPLKNVVERAAAAAASRVTFADPNSPDASAQVYLDRTEIDQGIFRAVAAFAPPRDDHTLEQLAKSLNSRAAEALAVLKKSTIGCREARCRHLSKPSRQSGSGG